MESKFLFFSYDDEGRWKKTYSLLWQKINSNQISENSFVLFKHKDWNDYGFFSNFKMYYFKNKEDIIDLDIIKIIQKNTFDTTLPKVFSSLGENTYYSRINYGHKKKIRDMGCEEIFEILNEVEEKGITSSELRKIDDSGSLESGFISSLYRDNEPSSISSNFGLITRNFIHELRLMLKSEQLFQDQTQREIYLKLLFGNSITLLESYLSDIIRSNIMVKETYFKNFLKFDNFGKDKIEMEKIGNSSKSFEEFLKSIVNDKISNITYHKVNYVQRIFIEVFKFEINLAKFSSDVNKRNDIFHRNGKTKKGEQIILNCEDIEFLLKQIERTINEIEEKLSLN